MVQDLILSGKNASAEKIILNIFLYQFLHKVRLWTAGAAKKFRHKIMPCLITSDTIYSVASLPWLSKAGDGSIINF
jgi:hypothetical protein